MLLAENIQETMAGLSFSDPAYGKTYFGIIRSTFVIGPDGTVVKAFPRVDPKTHADKVLAALDAL